VTRKQASRLDFSSSGCQPNRELADAKPLAILSSDARRVVCTEGHDIMQFAQFSTTDANVDRSRRENLGCKFGEAEAGQDGLGMSMTLTMKRISKRVLQRSNIIAARALMIY